MKINKRKLLIPILILIDQITKLIVIKFANEEIITINKFISIHVVGNTGIALGINSGENIRNILLSLVFIIIILKFLKNQKDNIDKKTEIILYMILAGGISNLIDRIIRGAIVDFISIGIFPIFNLADILIVTGWILFIIFLVFYSRKEVKQKE